MMSDSKVSEDRKDAAAAAGDGDDVVDNYDFVRFTLADIHGISRSKLVPRRHVADKLRTGITMVAGMCCA